MVWTRGIDRTKDLKVSPSISWHLADIWLEELNKVVAEETEVSLPSFRENFL